MTSLTREAFLEKGKPRFAWVEVEGWGKFGIRTCPNLKYSHRWVTYSDPQTGEIIPSERAKSSIHELIDQVMVDEETPMFTEEDFDYLAALDPDVIAPVTMEIRNFNNANQKKVTEE